MQMEIDTHGLVTPPPTAVVWLVGSVSRDRNLPLPTENDNNDADHNYMTATAATFAWLRHEVAPHVELAGVTRNVTPVIGMFISHIHNTYIQTYNIHRRRYTELHIQIYVST